MGRCLSCLKSNQSQVSYLPEPSKLTYGRGIVIEQMLRPDSAGMEVQLRGAETVDSKAIDFQERRLLVSGKAHTVCTLPGHSGEGEQRGGDAALVEGSCAEVLVGLFDGHGQEGKYAANLCKQTCLQAFQHVERRKDVETFLETALNECDQQLKGNEKVFQSQFSGSYLPFRAALLLHLTAAGQLTLACVGDSRCLLSSSQPEVDPPVEVKPLRGSALQNITHFSQTRAIPHFQCPIQLSHDQHPSDPEELVRIFKAGGRVNQRTDSKGTKVGRYKVFGSAKGPGLAMSRSIGNCAGLKLGVTAEPIVTEYRLRGEKDQVLVLASKLLWEVMSNSDAVGFVEKYRHSCPTCALPSTGEITCYNATIAQLLCEEARLRLLLAGSEADDLAEDLTCIVVEIQEKAPILTSASEEQAMVIEPRSVNKNAIRKQILQFS